MRRRVAAGALAGALAAAISAGAACGAIVGPDASTSAAALFDQVWSDVDAHYSLFVVKQINWDSLRATYRPLAVAASSDNGDLAAVITEMLGTLHDGHVLFQGMPPGASLLGTGFDWNTSVERYVQTIGSFESGVSYGMVNATTGYINIGTFEGHGWLSDIDSVLTALDGVSSIIIDIRNNQGGFIENATGAAGRFADRTTTIAYVRYRNGPAHTDFAAALAQQVSPSGSRHFAGKVYLLTSRNTISAGELFVLSMRALGRTTVVGDTTAGEAGSPFARQLQNGWTYQFPESIEYTLDGHWFEDIGLPPDVPVQNTPAQFDRSVDAQLARAIALAAGN
jgi:carboxyl-terminal processing protease